MDISNWSTEDFVLDPAFRKWVLNPDAEAKLVWEEILSQNPGKLEDIKNAREILMQMSVGFHLLPPGDKDRLWRKVVDEIKVDSGEERGNEAIPLNAYSTIKKMEMKEERSLVIPQIYRVAAILLVVFGLSWTIDFMVGRGWGEQVIELVEYVEHIAPPGVKSKLTLTDGSRVVLNSGSRLYYVKHFEADKRELFLEGEAYFEVFRDSVRPFVVRTGTVFTTALGTSFNIDAYETEAVNIYLLTGKVLVADSLASTEGILLERGEAALMDKNGGMNKGKFDEERVTAWTKGVILFDRTPMLEAIKTLENWFGVPFDLRNHPPVGLTVSGKFDNEQLKNILEGLSYSARFRFEMEDEKVKLSFINP